MDLDNHHRSTSTTGGELFICFTSRLSSTNPSSMKLSKSILSPGRARDAPLSLSTSLSRRLRTNGSLKGGQASPMFPSTGKKRGSGFDNPEPSSPKVTCIGQVRVKTKKKVKQTRSLSRRRSGSGEVSFRKLEQAASDAFNQTDDRLTFQNQRYSQGNSSVHYQQQECVSHRNQRWVHLPLTICEALRAFGAEFSCLFPCGSSCFSNEREKEMKGDAYRGDNNNNEQRSCGAVFARWLVAVQDGEGGKRRDLELVVGPSGEEEEEEERTEEARHSTTMRSSRRHVFDNIEFKDEIFEVERGIEEEKGRVSVCIPPKNALLLMRCRSDPMKMAALTNRFRDSPVPKDEDEEVLDKEEELVYCQKCEHSNEIEVMVPAEHRVSVDLEEIQVSQEETEVMEMDAENIEQEKLEANQETCELAAETVQEETKIESFDAEVEFLEESAQLGDNQQEEEEMTIHSRSSSSTNSDSSETSEEAALKEEEKFKSAISKQVQETVLLGYNIDRKPLEPQQEFEHQEEQEEEEEEKQVEVEYTTKEPENEEKESVLPECLLLMMCEPKLSMEVSKETWVCRRDFLRWLPERKQQVKLPKKEVPEEPKRRRSTDTRPPNEHRNKHMLQPPRSSCSLPGPTGMSMATMIEQKLVNAVAYEPFVLTRCKSEPMRTAATKLAPDACCWKNRKIEPHRPATFGVGAAGVGF